MEAAQWTTHRRNHKGTQRTTTNTSDSPIPTTEKEPMTRRPQLRKGMKVTVTDNATGEKHPGILSHYDYQTEEWYLKDCKFLRALRQDIEKSS